MTIETQPICRYCWPAFSVGVRSRITDPPRIKGKHRRTETCCICGDGTRFGAYIKAETEGVPYPTINEQVVDQYNSILEQAPALRFAEERDEQK